MRVGIVTLYRGYNYGTSLQAYALRNYIASLGYEAEIIWTRENANAGRDVRVGKILRILVRSCLSPTLFRRTFGGYRGSISKEISPSIRDKFLSFTEMKLNVHGMTMKQLKGYAASGETAAVVCGSDQIWSAAGANVEPLYYLRFVPRRKRVAYAPSMGVSSVPGYNRRLLKKYIGDFPQISVRERQGAEIVKELTGREVPVVLDPTLLIDWKDGGSPLPERDYIVAYFLDTPSEEAVESIRRIAERHSCQIVMFPYHFENCQSMENVIYPDVGPEEFPDWIRHAQCVCTDSFHGTAFSVNLGVPFWTFPRNYGAAADQSSRITSFLEQLGLGEQYAEDGVLRETVPELNFSEIKVRLDRLKNSSARYLKTAISNVAREEN